MLDKKIIVASKSNSIYLDYVTLDRAIEILIKLKETFKGSDFLECGDEYDEICFRVVGEREETDAEARKRLNSIEQMRLGKIKKFNELKLELGL